MIEPIFTVQARSFRLAASGVTVIFAVWFCLGMLWYIPNNGGSGLALPLNTLCWITIAITLGWLAFTLPGEYLLSRPEIAIPSPLWLLPSGALMWSLPLMWSPYATARSESLPHVAACWGLLCLFWWLRRLPRQATLAPWLTLLWIAALLQGLFSFLQVVVLTHYWGYTLSRPVGIFQQVNVLASFLSTGLVCLFVSEFQERRVNPGARVIPALRIFALLFIPFMLLLLQSRVGWLGGGLAVVIVSLINYRKDKACAGRLRVMWLLMLAGILLALAWQHGIIAKPLNGQRSNMELMRLPLQFTAVDKAGSNSARVFMIQQTLQMIVQHPWRGVGYGYFEGAFAHQVAAAGDLSGERTIIHPHNELLYAWAEGGVVAVLGLLMMVVGILVMLWRRNGMGWTGAALLLPVALHMNLEYPLYQSVPHGLVLAILLSLVLPAPVTPVCRQSLSRRSARYKVSALQLITLNVCVMMLFYMVGCLQSQNMLTMVEQQDMYPLALDENQIVNHLWNPQSQKARLDYDLHVAKLIRYNFTHDNRLLEQFDDWAAHYQLLHKDPNVMASRLKIAQALTPGTFPRLCAYAHQEWPHDPRFDCEIVTGNSK
ncbi:Wzy polymerase domain-containing protein [Enterobacter sp. DRP3]|nr:Wzy polymerase domain-containing protein [Enterobacter sp. DRP3]